MAAAPSPLAGQVALVAGATRGAGRGIARALSEAGALVYWTGRSAVGHTGGMDRPETEEVSALAARLREEAGRLDVLVNSIWGGDPMVDWGKRFWEADLSGPSRPDVGHQPAPGAADGRGRPRPDRRGDRRLLLRHRGHILYDLVKAALARLAYGMAMELVRTGVTALAISPGFLRSEAVLDHFGVSEDTWREAIAKDPYFAESETPALVGRAVAALAADPAVRSKAGMIHFAGDLAREYGFTDVDGRTPDFFALFDAEAAAMAKAEAVDDRSRFLMWARYCQIHQDPGRGELAALLAEALGLRDLGPGLAPATRA